MSRKLGVLGLGMMGLHVALNLSRAGYETVAYDPKPDAERDAQLIEGGVTLLKSSDEVLETSEVLVTFLPDSAVVERMVEAACKNKVSRLHLWIDMTSGLPSATRRLSDKLSNELNVRMIDAPSCNGGIPGIKAGTVTLCVGGATEHVEAATPYLEAIASEVIHVGEIGAGHMMKTICNALALGAGSIVAEAYSVGARNGLEFETMREALRRTVAGRTIALDVVERDFFSEKPVTFTERLATKDLRYMADEAARVGVPAPTVGGALSLALFTMANGLGDAAAVGSSFRMINPDAPIDPLQQ